MFDLVLLDVRETIKHNQIRCVVKDLYSTTYCAISYRWGEEQPWLAQTPNYDCYIISFPKENILQVCNKFSYLTNYIWVDTISIHQANREERKKAINKMYDIYHYASHVIAIPDLGFSITDSRVRSIVKYTGVENMIEGIRNYKRGIAEFHRLVTQTGYYHLRELVKKWSERAWVVSERSIGEGKMLVYILCMDVFLCDYPVFNLRLHDSSMKIRKENNDYNTILCILRSKSTVLKDRLSAIIPHTKYCYNGEDVNDAMDLRMKLFQIFDSDEGRASLLFYFNYYDTSNNSSLPSYISMDDPGINSDETLNILSVYCHIQTIEDKLLITSRYHIKLDHTSVPPRYCHLLEQWSEVIGILLLESEGLICELICAGNNNSNTFIILRARICMNDYVEGDVRTFVIN